MSWEPLSKKLPMFEKCREALAFMKARGDKGVALFQEMGTCKALPLTEIVLTPTGWTTMGEIHVGDYVIGKNGLPTKVLGVYPQGEVNIFRITFSDGKTVECSGDHLWEVNTPLRKWRKMPPMVLSVAQLMTKGLKHANGNRKYYIPLTKPVQFKAQEAPLPLDPYLLGILLGDGYLRKGGVTLSSGDNEIIEAARDLVPKGVILNHKAGYDYDFTHPGVTHNELNVRLKALGLLGKKAESKFVPPVYLYASSEERESLLQGLLDTDGGIANKHGTGVGFGTASKQLSDDITFLVESLGGVIKTRINYPTYTYKGKKLLGQISYGSYIRLPNTIQPFRLTRKKRTLRTKYPVIRGIESIEPVGRAAAQCIKVAAQDGLFLIRDFVVTHNTRESTNWLAWLFSQGCTLAYVAAPLSVMHVWVEEWNLWAKYPVTFIDLHELGSEGLRLAQQLSSEGYPVICLVNYEKSWQIGMKWVERVISKGAKAGETVKEFKRIDTTMDEVDWDAGILDEVTAIKNRGSKVSQFFRKKMRQKTRFRAVLTGSAYTKRPLDVWAQIMFACRDEIFSPKFEEFAAKYAIPHPDYRGQFIGYCNLDDFTQRLSKIAVLLKKEDVAELPPVVHQTRLVTLSPRSRKLYDEITKEMYAEFEALEREHEEAYAALKEQYETEPDDAKAGEIWDDMETLKRTAAVTAEHVFARAAKWKQITSGYVIPDLEVGQTEKSKPVRLGTEKLGVLLEVLEERDGKPTVIVVQADEEEAIIAEALEKQYGVKPKVLNGSVAGAERRHAMIAAAANDPFFIVKEAVGCRGVDMRFTDCIVFFSHRPMTEAYEQMVSRSHRVGVKHSSINCIHILAKNTYDMKIMNILKKDLDLAREIERNWRALFGNEEVF